MMSRARGPADWAAAVAGRGAMAGRRSGTMPRMNELAITVIGHDRPGIMADVAEVLAGLGVNLTDSTMTRLRGHFAMTLVCAGAGRSRGRGRAGPADRRRPLLATVRAVRPTGRRAPAGGRYVMACTGRTGWASSRR